MVLHVLRDKQLRWQHTLLALRENRAARVQVSAGKLESPRPAFKVARMNVHIWAAVVIACLAFGAALAALGLTLATIR